MYQLELWMSASDPKIHSIFRCAVTKRLSTDGSSLAHFCTMYQRLITADKCLLNSIHLYVNNKFTQNFLMPFSGKVSFHISICQIRHCLVSIPPLTNTLCAVVLRLAFISALPPPSLSFPQGSATYLSYVNSLAAPLPVSGSVYPWQKGSPQGRFLEATGLTRADILSCSWRCSLDTRKRYKSLTPTHSSLRSTCVDIPRDAPLGAILTPPVSNDRVSGRVV